MPGITLEMINDGEARGAISPQNAALMRERYQQEQIDKLNQAALAMDPSGAPMPAPGTAPGLPSSAQLASMDPAYRAAVLPAALAAGKSVMGQQADHSPQPAPVDNPLVPITPEAQAQRMAPPAQWPPVPAGGLGGIARDIARQRKGFEARTKGRMGELDDARDLQARGLEEQRQAAQDRARETSNVWAQAAAENQRAAEEQQAFRSDYDARLAAQKAELAEARQDARFFGLSREDRQRYQQLMSDPGASSTEKALAKSRLDKAQEIDPKAAFPSTSGKILAAIAMAMGSYAAAYTGRNDALTIINKAIDDSIEAQRTKAQMRRDAVTQAEGDIATSRQEFFDGQQAITAQKLAKLDTLQAYLSQIAAKYEGTEAAANISQLQGELAQQATQLEQTFDSDAHGRSLQAATSEASVRAQNQQLATQKAAMAAERAAANAPARSPIPGTALVDPSLPVDKDAVKEARKRVGDYNQVQGLLGDLAAWRREHGAEVTDRKAINEARQMANRLIVKLKVFDEMGANFTDMERELINRQVPEDPTEVGFVLDRLESMSGRLRSEIDQYLQPRNIQLADADHARRSLGSYQPN